MKLTMLLGVLAFCGCVAQSGGIISQRPAYAGPFRRVYDLINEGRDSSDPELASTYAKYLYMCNLGIFRNRLTRDGKGRLKDYEMTDFEKLEIEQRMRHCGFLE